MEAMPRRLLCGQAVDPNGGNCLDFKLTTKVMSSETEWNEYWHRQTVAEMNDDGFSICHFLSIQMDHNIKGTIGHSV